MIAAPRVSARDPEGGDALVWLRYDPPMRAHALPLVSSLLATACFNPSSSTGSGPQGTSNDSGTSVGSTSQGCAVGDAGCDCYPNATCNDSLLCDDATMLCVPDDCVSATQGCPCIESQCLPGLVCDAGLCQPGAADTGSSTGAGGDSSSSSGGEPDLVLHLPLDDDFMAISGATDAGPLALPVVCDGPSCPATVPGRIGNAAGFAGSSYLTVAGTGPLDLEGAFTIAVWVRDTTSSTSTRVFLNRLVGEGDLASYEIEFYAGQLFAAVSDGTMPYTLGVAHTFDPDQPWFHVALVVDGATATLYRDAVAIASVDGVSIGYQDAPLVVGADNDAGNIFDDFFVGELDDLRVYARALDDAELAALVAAAG